MPWRVRIVYNGRDHSCCCLSTCSCLDRGSTHTEVGAIGSDKLELLEDNVLKPEEDQHSKLTVLFKSSK